MSSSWSKKAPGGSDVSRIRESNSPTRLCAGRSGKGTGSSRKGQRERSITARCRPRPQVVLPVTGEVLQDEQQNDGNGKTIEHRTVLLDKDIVHDVLQEPGRQDPRSGGHQHAAEGCTQAHSVGQDKGKQFLERAKTQGLFLRFFTHCRFSMILSRRRLAAFEGPLSIFPRAFRVSSIHFPSPA